MNKENESSKKLDAPTAIWLVAIFTMAMSVYAYVRLSQDPRVLTAAIVVLAFLETVRIILDYQSSRRIETGFDAAFFVVFLSVILGALRTSLGAHPIFLFATVFYRPQYTRHGNRRLALALSCLILLAVLPITSGLVTDREIVRALTLFYALLVGLLWLFCSKVGAAVTRSRQSEST